MDEKDSNFINPIPCPAYTNTPQESTPEAAWKHLPPYEAQAEEEFGPIKWRGKCLCGKATYILKREKPLNAKFCHCRVCQVTHGAPLQWAAIFHKHDMSFTSGTRNLVFYSSTHQTQKHMLPTKVSCANCRTPIMDEGRNMCLIFPELIEIEGSTKEQREKREVFKPTCHIFYESRMLDFHDGLPKWSGMENSSDQMDDGEI
ncbi:Glutathione-dependent formaldehyde-activating enzyme/centromere protein V [Penicillium coprophilum]|uniref:Glutathione-dependent formaldehyde-activating enzyme/centromere protein V n=1 Tax=Penicillium coprophilum TaxID=36646 RepID=UPI00239A3AFA|nr:Glutathione-dependent formaldehyde-activating enzyme/centromere protein V [Penicillium coprophilum]KAJ5165652.1 Glutathione-dependent formaldehyde-activating enzyme/centromere protein V [Penicillium coprophilum]